MMDTQASLRCRLISFSLLPLLLSATPPASAEAIEEEHSGPVTRSIRDDAVTLSVAATDGAPILSGSLQGWQTVTCLCESNPLHRAGHPECVKRGAVPSDNGRYGGYYVGGGLPLRGEGPCVYHEGTWGWDYFGGLFQKKIALNWSHGRRRQGDTGAYKTDGPKLFHH